MTQSGDGIVADALIDGAAELAIWKAYLASGDAAPGAMSPLELDGFLTGVIVSQEPVPFARWHRLVWGCHEPLFTKELHFAASRAVVRYAKSLAARIDQGKDYRPMFASVIGKADPGAVRQWVRSFWRAMQLQEEALFDLVADEAWQAVLCPFIGFLPPPVDPRLRALLPNDGVTPDNAQRIPTAVLLLYHRAEGGDLSEVPTVRVSRNAPCRCGSGKKAKRCCSA